MVGRLSLWFVVAVVSLGAGVVAWRFSFFVAPFWWTEEPSRLAGVLGLQRGMQVADIGAGTGALAARMAELVGSGGTVFASELDPQRRAAIEGRIRRFALGNLRVVTGTPAETQLPAGCCDAVYMRAVFHHIEEPARFAADVARTLRPGGRLAVIDFAPGALWFHGPDHGVRPELVVKIFDAVGLRLERRVEHWGGGMYLLVFQADPRLAP